MLDELIARSQEYDSLKQDYGPMPAANMIRFHETSGNLVLPPTMDSLLKGNGETELEPTWHAFKQICARLGLSAWPGSNRALPAEYLMVCPSSMRARQLNHWLKRLPDLGNEQGPRQWFVRGYDDHWCRAVLTDRYSVVDVTETLKWVKEALDSKGTGLTPVIIRPAVTPDVLHLKVLFKDVGRGNGGDYAVGGYFTTGEIGNRLIGAYPLVQRHSCTNSIIIPGNKFSWEHVHTGSRAVLKELFIASIFEVLKGSLEALERLLAAQRQDLPKFTDYIDDLAAQYGWTTEVRDQVLLSTEGYETLFGVVNGISGAANRIEDPTDQANMQALAGELLYARVRA